MIVVVDGDVIAGGGGGSGPTFGDAQLVVMLTWIRATWLRRRLAAGTLRAPAADRTVAFAASAAVAPMYRRLRCVFAAFTTSLRSLLRCVHFFAASAALAAFAASVVAFVAAFATLVN